ncbi:hypothetical protein [Escherichia coli]
MNNIEDLISNYADISMNEENRCTLHNSTCYLRDNITDGLEVIGLMFEYYGCAKRHESIEFSGEEFEKLGRFIGSTAILIRAMNNGIDKYRKNTQP